MALGTRAVGILEEIARQIGLGRPEEVAERIAEGKLDMRPEAIIERQEDLYPTTAFHGGGDDIRIVDPNRVTSGKTANTGFFMSSSPVNAASYADRAGNIMPLAVDTRGFDVVNAGYNDWNRITNPDYLLGGERLATFGELPGYRGTMEPDRGIFDLNVVRDFDTDELARTARRFGSPGLIVQNVSDVGPNYKSFDPAFEAMTGLRVGDEGYQEALDTFFTDTIVASDPTRVRSLFAAFDPEYKGSNILGERAIPVAGAGLLAAAAMSPEEAEAGVLSNLIKAGYPEEVAQRIASGELPMDEASRMNRRREMGYDKKVYHTGAADITAFDPYAGFLERADTGTFVTDDPILAQSYMAPGRQTYPLYIRDREMPYLDAGGRNWSDIDADLLAPDDELIDSFSGATTNEIAREALYRNMPGVEFRGVMDMGPNIRDPFTASKERTEELSRMYVDPDVEVPTVYSVADPTLIRSQFAAFDPKYKGPNILGGTAAGALGLTALMAPEEAEAKTPEFLASLPQLEPYEPGMVETAVQNVAQFLKDIGATESDYRANRMASSLSNVADFTPVVGDAKGFAEARDAFSQGNYGEAALLGGLGLLGLIPLGGDILAGAAKGMFIGPSARNFNFEQMRRHQEMEEAGKSQREILAETGMFRGADGRVRSEISDATAKSTPFPFGKYPTLDGLAPIQNTVGGILEHPELFKNYPFLQDVKVNNMAMTDPGTMHQAGGYYDPNTGELTLNPLAASSEDATRNIMLHELQHMIQEAEGFAKGGNPESSQRIAGMINRQEFQDAFDYGLEETAYKRTEILDELRALRPAETLYRMQNINRPKDLFNSQFWYQFNGDVIREIGPPPRKGQASLDYAQRAGKVISRLLQTKGYEQSKYAQGQERLDEVGSDIKRLIRNAEAKLKRYDANPKNQEAISAVEERKRRNTLRLNETERETYDRFGGEVESRNTEARQAMTMEERLATPYYLTQDTPNRQQEMYRLTDRGHLITYPERNRFDLLYPRGLLGE